MNETSSPGPAGAADHGPAPDSDAGKCSGLVLGDFERLDAAPPGGIGAGEAGAAAWFRDALYVGIDGGRGRRARLLRHDPAAAAWECVFDGPAEDQVRPGGARAAPGGWRFLTADVLHSAGDPHPVLYVGLGDGRQPWRLLRCEDGRGFVECDQPGFGLYHAPVVALCSPVARGGRVFSAPAAARHADGPVPDTRLRHVLETGDPLHGGWVAAGEPAFGDDHNLGMSALALFEGCLYAATVNRRRGFQLWKCDPAAGRPLRWQRLIVDGAFRPLNAVVTSLTAFGGALYLFCGHGRDPNGRERFGPFPAEILRVWPDDSWELIAGQPRFTPQGCKRPLSNRLGGLDDYFVREFTACEYDGWLYCAGESARHAPDYLMHRSDLSPARREWLEEESAARRDGEFSLWRTRDGEDWQLLGDAGMPGGDPDSCGVRAMVASPVGLFLFPRHLARGPERHRRRGPEIWLGRRRNAS